MLPSAALSTISWMLLSCLMLISQVQGEDVVKSLPAARITCPKGSVAYFSYCYALYTTPAAWMDAEISCQSRHSGHLTSILTGSEASFVSSLIKSSSSRQTYVWIGLHDPTEGNYPNGGGWMWSSTDVMNYQIWEKRPPTNPNFGFCGSVTQSSGFRKWKDYNCDIKLPYVCKFKN
ncbi:lithostathine-like isoform X1 [Suncus etruscus]|uniref:lithostathine-like isoform X1 n=1 Tax=Suncus etruscus TaxID=109475 RepID=UPI00210F42AF|nr:lithostathine-like isoform X1 [Suncus etruscus]